MARTNYQQRLRPVIRYLEANYREPLNLEEVAELAALSPYHFHRVFRATMQETLANYLLRLKLEDIAQQLFFREVDMTSLAIDNGFSSSQALAKAFKRHFGFTMSEVRSCQSLADFTELMENRSQKRKIGHADGNLGHDSANVPHYADDSTANRNISMSQSMKTEHFDQRTLAYIRVTGPYGQGYDAATEQLYAWAGAHNLADGDCLFIYRDSPEVTAAEQCRTDICLSVPADTAAQTAHPDTIEFQTLAAGSYASIRRSVTTPDQYAQYWEEAINEIVRAGLVVDNHRLCFELYHSYDPATHHADVSFYTAIDL